MWICGVDREGGEVDDPLAGAEIIVDSDEGEINFDFTDEEFIRLARSAHEQDITINQYIQKALQYMMDNEPDK